jgi:hypothetical protein
LKAHRFISYDENPLPKVKLDNDDLAYIVDGCDQDDTEVRPFTKFFTKERIVKSWENIGFVPFTRQCLAHPKVRHELGQKSRNNTIEDLQTSYVDLMLEAEADGMNPVFDAVIATAIPVNRQVEQEDRINDLVKQGGAFQISKIWQNMGTMVANCGEILEAGRQQERMKRDELAAKAALVQARDNKKLTKAKAALTKKSSGVSWIC